MVIIPQEIIARKCGHYLIKYMMLSKIQMKYPLFEYTTEKESPEGYERMETCFEKGKKWIEAFLAQEVYSTQKIIVKGRESQDLVKDTITSLSKRKKKAEKNQTHSENFVIEEQPPPPIYNQEVGLSDEQMVIDIDNES